MCASGASYSKEVDNKCECERVDISPPWIFGYVRDRAGNGLDGVRITSFGQDLGQTDPDGYFEVFLLGNMLRNVIR